MKELTDWESDIEVINPSSKNYIDKVDLFDETKIIQFLLYKYREKHGK